MLAPNTVFETRFISTTDVIAIIKAKGLAEILLQMAGRIEAEFLRWQSFEKVARIANHSSTGAIELMPISDEKSYSFKYVNGHPLNTNAGLPTVMAFGMIADVETGLPRFVSELTLTTALRTAATSALAAKALARPDCKVMALIGNGAQSEFQALAFHHLCGINHVTLYDIDVAASDKLLRNLRAVSNLSVEICTSAKEAVKDADIITTVTADKTKATILTADMIEKGQHINGVGGDCPGKTELAPAVLEMGTVFVEYEPQTRIEGDIQQMPADFAVTELWQVLNGSIRGRHRAEQITIFDSVGFALEDFAALHVIEQAAQQMGLGQNIEFFPVTDDPKDLFGVLL